MDNDLVDIITDRMPTFNRDVVEGLAVAEVEHAESFLDRVWRCAQLDFPEGLVYKGCRRLKHNEEYLINTRRGSGTATLEMARTDTYMVAFHLSWQGQDLLPVHLSLPIVSDGGLMHIQGSKYSISPVLADVALSVGANYIFVPLMRDRITFHRRLAHIRLDGQEKACYVVWSMLHRENKKKVNKPGSRLLSSLPHYLFARFGVTETFRRYANAHVMIGTSETITRETHPPEHWALVSSTRQRPTRFKMGQYVASDLVIAIPREELTEAAVNLAAGFFYVADFYPQRVTVDDADETYLWMVLMGLTIWGSGESEGSLAQKTEAHLQSLDTHMDEESRRELRAGGVNVNDIYDLLMYLIANATPLMVEAHENLSSMYNKRLIVLRYLLKEVVQRITLFMYSVKANQKKPLTVKDINERLSEQIQPNLILKIRIKHGEVDTSVSSPGDNKYFKITSKVVKQVNSSGKSARSIALNDPANFLHASIAECGSYLTPSGSDPVGHERINPCIHTSPTRLIERNEDLRELIDDVQKRIRRR